MVALGLYVAFLQMMWLCCPLGEVGSEWWSESQVWVFKYLMALFVGNKMERENQ